MSVTREHAQDIADIFGVSATEDQLTAIVQELESPNPIPESIIDAVEIRRPLVKQICELLNVPDENREPAITIACWYIAYLKLQMSKGDERPIEVSQEVFNNPDPSILKGTFERIDTPAPSGLEVRGWEATWVSANMLEGIHDESRLFELEDAARKYSKDVHALCRLSDANAVIAGLKEIYDAAFEVAKEECSEEEHNRACNRLKELIDEYERTI